MLQEIRHTAQENGGAPLGVQRFSRAQRAERKGSFFCAWGRCLARTWMQMSRGFTEAGRELSGDNDPASLLLLRQMLCNSGVAGVFRESRQTFLFWQDGRLRNHGDPV